MTGEGFGCGDFVADGTGTGRTSTGRVGEGKGATFLVFELSFELSLALVFVLLLAAGVKASCGEGAVFAFSLEVAP